MKTGRRTVLVGLAALPAACGSPNPTLYVLAVQPGATVTGTPRNIEMRAVSLPRYLERSGIVRSSDNYRVDVLANDWWGEPLGAMLTRVLTEELGQRLPSSTVYADSGAISATPDVTIEVNVQRFDQDRSGQVLLSGQFALEGKRSSARGFALTQVPASATTAALVAAMSLGVSRLADQIAASLGMMPVVRKDR